VKKYVVIASLMAGFSMISGAAFAQTTGYIDANYSRVDAGAGDADAYGISGGAAFQSGMNMRILLDASYFDTNDIDVKTLSGTGHLVWDSGDNAFGGFLGLVNNDATGGDTTTWAVGGEYARFFQGGTLALGAGYANNDDADVDLYGVNGEWRFFASDNLRFDIGGGWANVDSGIGGDDDGTFIGAGFEWRVGETPFSVGANYANVDFGGGDVDVIGVTARLDFGNGSLRARDRSGNTFGPLGGFGNLLRF
jgi:hypothetical protein